MVDRAGTPSRVKQCPWPCAGITEQELCDQAEQHLGSAWTPRWAGSHLSPPEHGSGSATANSHQHWDATLLTENEA